MTITQHAHIYSFHSSNFNFGDFFLFFFINTAPTDSHLKLLPYKVFEHIDMLSIGIQ
jgi:hypothetical protein